MTEAITPSIGWAVVHLFCKPTPLTDAEAIVAAVKDKDYGFRTLVHEIVQSKSFQTK